MSAFGAMLHPTNVNQALTLGLQLVKERGVPSESRGMKTLRVPGPVITAYDRPEQRVLLNPVRDANPFFHLMEAFWILAGADTVALPQRFLSTIDRFSDNGLTFHGAYGKRLRAWESHRHGYTTTIDQIATAITILRAKPDTRQVVLSIWDPARDLGTVTKDMPCNDMVMFDIVAGQLNLTVMNRSNDMIWGAYGANAVQFSVLQEYVAAAVGVDVGVYAQVSNNYHVYEDNPTWQHYVSGGASDFSMLDPYDPDGGWVTSTPICRNPAEALRVHHDARTLNEMMEQGQTPTDADFSSAFFQNTVAPMIRAYDLRKDGGYDRAYYVCASIEAEDWRVACRQWIERREAAARAKAEAAFDPAI